MDLLTDAKSYVDLHKFDKNGCFCPCCGQKAMVWKKALISNAVASLVKLVWIFKGKFIHLDDFNVLAKDRNFSQLVLWDLVAPAPSDEKRSSGMWAPTKQGQMFAKNFIRIPKYVLTYDNMRYGFRGPNVYAREILGRKFDYYELLEIQGGSLFE